jgi:hypothetical protein
MAGSSYYNSGAVDYSDFYSGSMAPPVSNGSGGLVPRSNNGGLTTRSVTTVPIDGRTGLPKIPTLSASAPKPPSWTQNGPALFAIQRQLAQAQPQTWAVDANGQRIDPIGYLPPGAPRPGGGLTPPRWGAPAPNWPRPNPQFPVTETPAIRAAWAAVQAGRPGALRQYNQLLADAAQAGNVNGGRGGNGGGLVPPTTIRGSSTGNSYNIGQNYSAGGYVYQAQPDGSFAKVGKDPNYVPRVNNQGAGGYTSSGQSRTLPSGESWAAGTPTSATGGGPAVGGSYGGS